MKFLLLLALFVVFMATETEGCSKSAQGQVEDAITLVFNIMDSNKDGTITKDDLSIGEDMSIDLSNILREYSHKTSARKVQKFSPFPS